MRRLLTLALTFLLPALSFAQAGPVPGGSGGGSSTITSGTSATSGCVAGGVLRSISNLVECGAGLTFDGTSLSTTGVVRAGLGSGAAPGYSFGTDTNTGLWAVADTVVVMSVNGSSVMSWGSGQGVNVYGTIANGSGDALSDLGGVGVAFRALYLSGSSTTGGFRLGRTITAGGTTGDRTINSVAGTVNLAAAATSITVTNNLITTSSIVLGVMRTDDTTCAIRSIVPGTGSFVINMTAACAAETSVGFVVTN